MPALTVYCSSSNHVDLRFTETAAEVGRAIAERGWSLVYGGNAVGCMGAVADAVRGGKGKVVGITPMLFDESILDRAADELLIADNMRHRKHELEARGDAFLTLPGGLGTFEEFFEIAVGRVLNAHAKPVVLLNVHDFYTPLLRTIDAGIDDGFIKPEAWAKVHVAETVTDAFTQLEAELSSD
ncbi:MAG: TIGR00730 family Rossman fold protein [Planctomycetota bacterium]